MFEKQFTIDISYSEHTKHFFINFSNEGGVIISVLITENVAVKTAQELGIKISR